MISPLRTTNDQIAATLRDRLRRDTARRRVEQPIAEVDRLIAECEELLLVGRKRVPLAMEPRLQRLSTNIPPLLRDGAAPAPELHAGVTLVHLMDDLFTLQEDLLGRRVDRAAYPDPEEAEPA